MIAEGLGLHLGGLLFIGWESVTKDSYLHHDRQRSKTCLVRHQTWPPRPPPVICFLELGSPGRGRWALRAGACHEQPTAVEPLDPEVFPSASLLCLPLPRKPDFESCQLLYPLHQTKSVDGDLDNAWAVPVRTAMAWTPFFLPLFTQRCYTTHHLIGQKGHWC